MDNQIRTIPPARTRFLCFLGERWLEKYMHFLTTMMINFMFTFTNLTTPMLNASVRAGSILFVTECRVCTISACRKTILPVMSVFTFLMKITMGYASI